MDELIETISKMAGFYTKHLRLRGYEVEFDEMRQEIALVAMVALHTHDEVDGDANFGTYLRTCVKYHVLKMAKGMAEDKYMMVPLGSADMAMPGNAAEHIVVRDLFNAAGNGHGGRLLKEILEPSEGTRQAAYEHTNNGARCRTESGFVGRAIGMSKGDCRVAAAEICNAARVLCRGNNDSLAYA